MSFLSHKENCKAFIGSITICAIDSILPHYSARALSLSSKYFKFDQTLLFSDQIIPGSHKNIKINKMNSIADYNNFILKKLNCYIDTNFVLIVQWDGFIINHEQWTDEYLNYDYIGAIWPQYTDEHIVGNGGFSLRSKKLLQALSEIDILQSNEFPEDEIICRQYRDTLENKFNIKFAPPQLANRFSYEQTCPEHITFGFHGFWNMLKFIDELEAINITNSLPKKYFKEYLIMKTFMNSFYFGYYDLMSIIYDKVVREIGEGVFNKTLNMALKFNQADINTALKISRKTYIRNEISRSS